MAFYQTLFTFHSDAYNWSHHNGKKKDDATQLQEILPINVYFIISGYKILKKNPHFFVLLIFEEKGREGISAAWLKKNKNNSLAQGTPRRQVGFFWRCTIRGTCKILSAWKKLAPICKYVNRPKGRKRREEKDPWNEWWKDVNVTHDWVSVTIGWIGKGEKNVIR